MARKSEAQSGTAIHGSTNVFADLGLPDAEERQTKLRLAYAINQILEEGQHTQAAASLLKVNQPKVTAKPRWARCPGFRLRHWMAQHVKVWNFR